MKGLFSLTAALVSALSFSAPAWAQFTGPCDTRANILNHLSGQYKEVPVAMGLTSSGAVIEVLTSPSGTWTFLVTYPNGLTCLFASGEAWESVPAMEKTTGDRT